MTDELIASAAPNAVICPHLGRREADEDGGSLRAIPDGANRCLALADPIHLSPDQQRLVCATERHRTCRRFVLAESGAAPTAFVAVRPLLLRPAVVGALVLLGVAIAVAVGYLVGGGSLLVAATPS